MSEKFDGFTQDDINKFSKGKKNAKVVLSGRGIRRMPDNKTLKEPKGPLSNEKNLKKIEIMQDTTDDSMTSLQEAVHFRPLSAKIKPTEEICDESILHITSNENKLPDFGDKMNASPFRGVSLKDFELQRRRMEEQNKQKKQLLYKAIEAHSKKTADEAKKIQEIKAELAKLDNDLAADVAILRKEIESACFQYYNVQKQYNKIESQFLKAKLELHNASERKELLTEHLCTVIAHNEDRKARKLSELMEKVGISCNDNIDDI